MATPVAKLKPKPTSATPEETLIRVLHVDDEPGLLKTTKQILEAMGSFQVETALSVKEAMQKLEEKEFDAVVTDYQMPRKNGLDFLRELRENENNIPLILFTGKGREEVAIEALNLGASLYCNKTGKPQTVYGELAYSIQQVFEKKRAEEALRRETEMLEVVTQNVSAGLVVISRDYKILWTNKLLKDYLGNVKGKDCYSTLNHLSHRCPGCGVKEIFEKGENRVVHEQLVLRADGEPAWLEITATPIRDKKGNVTAALELSTDITERKKAEKALKEAKNRFETYLNLAGVIMVALDTNGTITYANKKCCEVLESKEEEIVGKNWFSKFLPKRIRSKTEAVFKKLMSGNVKPVERYENPILTKQGEERIIAWHNILLKDENGKIIRTLSSGEDITERKKAEEALEKSEEEYRTIVELSPDGIITMNMQGTVTSINKAFLDLTGFSEAEIVGKHFSKLGTLRAKDLPKYTKLFAGFLTGKPPSIDEFAYVRKDGSHRWGDAHFSFIKKDGKNVGIQAVLRDITERKRMAERLKESEEKYRMQFEQSLDAIFVADAETGIVVDCNLAATELVDRKKSEIVGKHQRILHPSEESNGDFTRTFKQHLKEKEGKVLEARVITKSGRIREVAIKANILELSGKRLIQGTFRDITEQKKAEEELRASEKKYRELINGMNDTAWVIDFDCSFIDVNDAAVKVLGYSREELLSMNVFDIDFTLDPEEIKALVKGMPADEIQVFQTAHTTKDGKTIPVEISSSLVTYQGKQAILSIARNITERKRLEKALQESEERFRQVAENALEWIWEVDSDGLYTYASPAVEKLLGYKPEEIIGKKHFYEMFHPEDRENLKKVAFSAFKEKSSFRDFINRNVHKNGNTVWLSTSGVPILDDGGNLLGYRGADIDVTDRQQAEDAVDNIMNELEKVIEKLRVVGKATRHDARNKLSVITNNVYLAKQKLAGNHNALGCLDDVESAVEQIEKIFDFARTYEMVGVEERSSIDVETSANEAVMLHSGLGDTKVVNKCHGLMVLADSQLRQIFYNLINNSLKHGKNVSQIRIYYNIGKDQLKLVYEDNGVGIPTDEKEKIFKEGYGKGTGYGLYLIKKICESYGWTIQETGTPGKGAQFTIKIPKKSRNKEINYQTTVT